MYVTQSMAFTFAHTSELISFTAMFIQNLAESSANDRTHATNIRTLIIDGLVHLSVYSGLS